METILVKKDETVTLPKYETPYSAGCDVKAHIDKDIIIKPKERALIPTGLFCEIPRGFEIQVRPRSGLALKKGITVLNTPGTVDADYRGMIGVILINLGEEPFEVHNGDRIAQLVLSPIVQANFVFVDNLSETERAEGGFGHTGV